MSSNKAKKLKQRLIETLCKRTKFDSDEVEILMQSHTEECNGEGKKMSESTFKNKIHLLLGLTDEAILERVFKYFDTDGDGQVNLDEWIVGLSTLLKGSFVELSNYCFRVYDINNDGFITKDDILYFLKDSFIQTEENEDLEELTKNLAEIAIKKMDLDKDGRISFEDYSKSVDGDQLFLEAFGACLPLHSINLHLDRQAC